VAHVDAGLQYRLRDIRFEEEPRTAVEAAEDPPVAEMPDLETEREAERVEARLIFPTAQLRKLFRINDGAIFDAGEIRAGLARVRLQYASDGFIDCAPTVTVSAFDADRLVAVVVDIDMGRPYRFGKITFLGKSPEAEKALKALIKPGEIANFARVREFYAEEKDVLPPGATVLDTTIHRDAKKGIVDLTFDLRPCN
jgi:outer membrane protein assembly factor BamA